MASVSMRHMASQEGRSLKKQTTARGKNKQKTRKDKNILNLKQVLRSELKRLAREQKPENEFD